MTDQNNVAQAAMQNPIYNAIFILTEEADSLSECHTRTPGDWAGEPEAKARYDHILAVVDALSKLRAPVAGGSLAAQALKSAQSNIAAYRPPGSSDPESSQYDHDAFMWDYYQRAIDSLALASAPVAEDAAYIAQLRAALILARDSHGVSLLTDPPQDAWKARHVDEVIRAALAAGQGEAAGGGTC